MPIDCVVYEQGMKLADIGLDEIQHYIHQTHHLVWVNLISPNKRDVKKVMSHFGIHELAIEDVLEGHQRPKLEEYDDSLFAVFHVLSMDEDSQVSVAEMVVFVSERFILTIHNDLADQLKNIRTYCERMPSLLKEGSSFIFYAILDQIIDSYLPFLVKLGAELDNIEDQIFDKTDVERSREIIKELYLLKRRLLILQHTLEPLVDPLSKIANRRTDLKHKKIQPYFRDVFEKIERILKTIEGRREMLVTVMQVNVGMISLAEGEMTKRLAAFAALFAIPTMIAGIYGMNFNNIPELQWKYGFYICLGFMIIADILIWRYFKKSKWL